MRNSKTNSNEQRAQQQFAEAVVLLHSRGINLSTIPTNVPYHRITALAYRGYLGNVPSKLDLGALIEYLRERGRLLALWALEHYPECVRLNRCRRGRSKMRFKLPKEAKKRPTLDSNLKYLDSIAELTSTPNDQWAEYKPCPNDKPTSERE